MLIYVHWNWAVTANSLYCLELYCLDKFGQAIF